MPQGWQHRRLWGALPRQAASVTTGITGPQPGTSGPLQFTQSRSQLGLREKFRTQYHGSFMTTRLMPFEEY